MWLIGEKNYGTIKIIPTTFKFYRKKLNMEQFYTCVIRNIIQRNKKRLGKRVGLVKLGQGVVGQILSYFYGVNYTKESKLIKLQGWN